MRRLALGSWFQGAAQIFETAIHETQASPTAVPVKDPADQRTQRVREDIVPRRDTRRQVELQRLDGKRQDQARDATGHPTAETTPAFRLGPPSPSEPERNEEQNIQEPSPPVLANQVQPIEKKALSAQGGRLNGEIKGEKRHNEYGEYGDQRQPAGQGIKKVRRGLGLGVVEDVVQDFCRFPGSPEASAAQWIGSFLPSRMMPMENFLAQVTSGNFRNLWMGR